MSSASIRAMLLNAMKVQGSAAKIGTLLKKGGYLFSATAPSSGRLVISWYTSIHGRKYLVATVTFVFQRAGVRTLKIAVTADGKKLLRRATQLKVTVNAAFTPTGKKTTTTTSTLALRR